MGYLWHMATAGLWSLVFTWGVGVGAIILILASIFFASWIRTLPVIGLLFGKLIDLYEKDMLWVAGAIALCMVSFGYGQHLTNNRWEAKEQVLYEHVQEVGKAAERDVSTDTPDRVRNDRHNRTNK